MKKIFNLSMGLLLAFSTDGLYSLTFNMPDGSQVTLSSYAGHKILIVVFNPYTTDFSQLKMLDSVQQDSPSVKVLAVPGIEFAAGFTDSTSSASPDSVTGTVPGAITGVSISTTAYSVPDSTIAGLHTRLGLSLSMTRAMYVKKTDTAYQHPLFVWLTHVGQNTHFDRDVDAEGQLYFINENGILYGVLGKGFSKARIEQVLSTQISQ
jgi:glutathione peroxidase-family protein